jgi:uncharacterized protein YlzI (FlbEa/FlbD family)
MWYLFKTTTFLNGNAYMLYEHIECVINGNAYIIMLYD